MPRTVSASVVAPLCAVLGGLFLLCLTGCGMGDPAAPSPVPLTVNGRVHGGQQAVVGAQIQLYVAGNAGNGSAASALLTKTVTSGTDGGFSITGDYSCPSATSQVYIVATQGNPGLGSGGNNPALAMTTALGSCGNLSASQFIWVNEVTTAAAAWALAPFAKDITHIGASSTNATGLANAFLNAQLIADTSTGNVAALASNLKTEPGKIYELADAVESCINSDGTSGCQPLFTAATPSGGSAPTNTWDAVMNIVKNPANNVGGVFAAIGPQPPFATSLTKAPNDWTLSLTVTGGAITSPESLAADSQGNIWVASNNVNGALVSAVNPQGTPLSGSGFGSTANLAQEFGLAVDFNDNVWVTDGQNPSHGTKGSVVRLSGVSSGGTLGTPTIFSDSSLDYPYAVAADTDGSIWIANYYLLGSSTSLVKLNPSTSTYTPINMGTGFGFAVAVAADPSHGAWATGTSGNISFAHADNTGSVVFESNCCGVAGAVALDSSNNVWVADTTNNTSNGYSGSTPTGAITEVSSSGTTEKDFITTGGITNPSHIAIDAGQNVWVSNLHTTSTTTQYESFSELAGANSSNPGAAISPSTGYGLDAGLLQPYALIVDPSGNVWVSNTYGNSLVMFFGMATPTKTPMPPTPVAP